MRNVFIIAVLGLFVASCTNDKTVASNAKGERWSEQKAKEWYAEQGWLRGCNFQPSTAINQLEMFQAETFDPETIDGELGWAASIGMNLMRVYLHHAAWGADQVGFKSSLNEYLSIADKHGIKTMFVIFDDVWNPEYSVGKQPEPVTGTHNSGWIQDPGAIIHRDPSILIALEAYVKDILGTYRDDKRVLAWDLYNEPGNSGWGNRSMDLLKKVFEWGREVNPSQPLTAGVWLYSLKDLNKFQVEHSDIITYHNYETMDKHQAAIDTLITYGRPLICTEYMARTNGSNFIDVMPELKNQNIGAVNWGLVSGKTNTIYAWNTPVPDGSEPEVWFHDIFRKDGSAYSQQEIDLIKSLTEAK
ncbi:cellulase family glycosylhydrolase [Saccharicrinis sp. FJH62]|uniref:cellulase family glycosylhydrolase n=1 Tax=Saccharicrinis sp. FJH62 TaxID=3344657 RepID=UPI0035D4F83C